MPCFEPFLSGAVFMAALTIGLFFLRYWKDTRDTFFLLFALAFFFFGVERVPMFKLWLGDELRGFIYLFRLVSFMLIIAAILLKNTGRPRSS